MSGSCQLYPLLVWAAAAAGAAVSFVQEQNGNWETASTSPERMHTSTGTSIMWTVGDVECQLDILRCSPLSHGLDPVALLTVDRPLLPVALVMGAFPGKIPPLSLTKLTHISSHLVFRLCWKVTRLPRGQACPHRKGLTPRLVSLSVHRAVGPCRCSGPRVTCDGAARLFPWWRA